MTEVTGTERRDRLQSTAFVVAFVLLISGTASFAISRGARPIDIAVVGFAAFAGVIVAFAAAVLWKIIDGKIRLEGLISEPASIEGVDHKPKASLSRFQFLIFTFVVAGLFLMLSIEAGTFVEVPPTVLALIGISGGSYIVSKAVGQAKPKKPEDERVADGNQGDNS